MKKLFLTILSLVLTVATFAQEPSLSYTYVKPQTAYTTTRPSSPQEGILRAGNTYIYNARAMRGREYSAFLLQNCTAAYITYEHGHNAATAGWWLLGGGAALCGMGWMLASGVTGDGLYSGVYMAYCGGLSMLSSVPTLIVGYQRMHHSADIYNARCARATAAYWSLNLHADGVGLALNF